MVQRRLPPSHPARHRAAGAGLTGHAVICGYGRVGRVIGAALGRRGLPFVVLDEDRALVRRAREQALPALLGNAANPVLLERANLGAARTLVVALPDPLAARQIVEYARRHHPGLDIVARTHSWEERAALTGRGVAEAVMGELDLALEMMRHALGRFGLSDLEALAEVERARARTVPAASARAGLQLAPAAPDDGPPAGAEPPSDPGGETTA